MQGKDTVTREQIIKWYRLSEMDDLLTESRIAMLGDFAIFARAALATTKAIDAIAPTEGAGQWVRCTPALIHAGVSCAHTPRRQKPGDTNHEHFIGHSAPSPESPAIDALTTGAVGEVKEKYPNIVWLDIYGRNLSDLVGAKLYFAPTPPASRKR